MLIIFPYNFAAVTSTQPTPDVSSTTTAACMVLWTVSENMNVRGANGVADVDDVDDCREVRVQF